jgi:drug/metabolite transporter (DMT)-like permease
VLLAAALWGASIPASKKLLGKLDEHALAGIFYTSAAIGLLAIRPLARRGEPLVRGDARWLAAAIVCGGILAPTLTLYGIRRLQAHEAGLLVNTEALFTALIAVLLFGERLRRRDVAAIALLVGGAALVIPVPRGSATGMAFVVGGALMWAVDNNVTQRLSKRDTILIAAIKGGVAGPVNLALAALMGSSFPDDVATVAWAAGVGVLAFGFSLALFIYGLRHLGASRTAALFSTAPAIAVALAVFWLGEQPQPYALAGGALMFLGTLLMLREPKNGGTLEKAP